MNEFIPKDKELYRRIDEVVHYLWDPIGVSDVPEARDEYHSYLPEICARVKTGDKDFVLQYPEWVVTDRMGMAFNRHQSNQAVEVMLHWKDVIYEHG